MALLGFPQNTNKVGLEMDNIINWLANSHSFTIEKLSILQLKGREKVDLMRQEVGDKGDQTSQGESFKY